LTLKDALFHPMYRRATWINIVYIIFHELTGINVINLYSNQIFDQMKSSEFTPRRGTELISVVSLIAALTALWLIKSVGRRPLIIWGHALIAIVHFGVVIFTKRNNETGVLIMIMLFIFIYQNTSGPIAWLYATETTIDAGLGICLLTLNGTVLLLAKVCPILMGENSIG
jgi:Na+/melibiose symporter-like transporter